MKNNPANCPCCNGKVLRHFQNSRIYWFCRHCWREVPLIQAQSKSRTSRLQELERALEMSQPLAISVDDRKPIFN